MPRSETSPVIPEKYVLRTDNALQEYGDRVIVEVHAISPSDVRENDTFIELKQRPLADLDLYSQFSFPSLSVSLTFCQQIN